MRLALLLFVAVAVGCGPPERPWCSEQLALPAMNSCEGCGARVRTRNRAPDSSRIFRLAFVPEGYPAEPLASFERQTTGWLDDFGARMDEVVPGVSAMLNASWFDFRELAPPDGFLLGSCATRDETGARLRVDHARLAELVPLEQFDAVIVVVNVPGLYRESAALPWWGVPTVMMHSWSSSEVFAHELGHALFNLSDEYVEHPGAPPRETPLAMSDPDLAALGPDFFFSRNVSLVPTSPKFGGARRGTEGAVQFTSGAFRSGEPCLMGNLAAPFCSACRSAIAERVSAKRGLSVANPLCGLEVARARDPRDLLELQLSAFDWDGVRQVTVSLPGRATHLVTAQPARHQVSVTTFTIFAPPAAKRFRLEATCEDRKRQQTRVSLEVER
jgi:hypothetical protein